jgi:glycosyltransferase involved in cell wall biosynthesis
VSPLRIAQPAPAPEGSARRSLLRPYHVLVVARLYPSADQPGRGTFVADLVRAVGGAGHDLVVASFETVQLRGPDGTRAARAAAAGAAWQAAVAGADVLTTPTTWGAGVPVARLPAIRTWGHGTGLDELDQVERHAEVLLAFGRALARRAPIDLIHAQTGVPDGLAADRLATELGVPLLVSEHDSTLPRRLAANERLAERYRELAEPDRGRAVAVVSPAFGARIRDSLGPDLSLEILPNPIAIGAFGIGDPPERDPDELLWVGLLAEHKGTPLLLAAFAELRRRRPRWRLRVVGPAADDDDARWRELAGALGIADGVTFEPRADRATVATAMRRASIFVHPSPWETFGVVAAEAIASGLPVAATPSGGVEWIVGHDGRFGVIAAASDPTSLADAIDAVHDHRSTFDPELMRASIVERFAPDRVADHASALYARLLAGMGTSSTDGDHDPESPERPEAPGAAATTVSGRPLIIGLHASALPRLNALPPGALAGRTVVTGPGTFDRPDDSPPPLRFEVNAAAEYRRRLASEGGLLQFRRRRQVVEARPAIESAEIRRVVAAAAGTLAGAGSDPVRVIAADADDALAGLDALGDEAVLAPGSLRWLADRSDVIIDPSRAP